MPITSAQMMLFSYIPFTQDSGWRPKTLGAKMPNDTSAGILVIEQLWAIPLKKALLHVGGELVAEGRIHPDKVSAAVEDFEQQK